MTTDILIPMAFKDLLAPSRYHVFHGGRGSAKSWSIATILIMMAVEHKHRILCCREFQNSIDDSVHHLLGDTISRLKLDNFFEVQRDTILGRNGSQFIFSGLKMNAKSIKSLENVSICWVEEAEAVSNDSWALLLPTIRAKDSTFFISFNRDTGDDPVWRRFGEKTPPGAIVRKVLWSDNPWLPAVLRDEIQWTLATDPEAYEHIWQGGPLIYSNEQIFRGKYVIREFEIPKDFDGSYFGADWGYAADPDAIIRCHIEEDCLFLDAEALGHGITITETPAFFDSIVPRGWPVRADSAMPGMIEHMNGLGYKIIAAKKGPGSVETGIKYLRGFREIVVHPTCVHTADELKRYSRKTDPRTGDILPIIKPGNDHLLDALRYATEPLWSTPPKWCYVDHMTDYSAAELGV